MEPQFEIVLLKTGCKSLRCLASRETFHPVVGPVAEARVLHVEQQRLTERARAQGKLVVWDVGLGAAANAIAAITALRGERGVEIHSFDRSLAPLEFALRNLHDLDYLRGHEGAIAELVRTGFTQIGPGIRWHFHAGDFAADTRSAAIPAPHAILFDPYSPVGNPDMWTAEVFETLRAAMPRDEASLLSTYSCSTSVRVNLMLAGFCVGIGRGVGEKAQTTIATNRCDALERPLDIAWLQRVRVSTNAAPLRAVPYSRGPISDVDFAHLCRHPQFSRAL